LKQAGGAGLAVAVNGFIAPSVSTAQASGSGSRTDYGIISTTVVRVGEAVVKFIGITKEHVTAFIELGSPDEVNWVGSQNLLAHSVVSGWWNSGEMPALNIPLIGDHTIDANLAGIEPDPENYVWNPVLGGTGGYEYTCTRIIRVKTYTRYRNQDGAINTIQTGSTDEQIQEAFQTGTDFFPGI
jgi:hypothetical protein